MAFINETDGNDFFNWNWGGVDIINGNKGNKGDDDLTLIGNSGGI